MKNFIIPALFYCLSQVASAAPDPGLGACYSPDGPLSEEQLLGRSRSECETAPGATTQTYLRCFFRVDDDARRPATSYAWAREADGEYYRVEGYWWSASPLQWRNMFYSDATQEALAETCRSTLEHAGIDRPLAMFAAANNALSFNHTIWSNDVPTPAGAINKLIAFGDSLSDTQNMYNASLWRLPNSQSWYLGRFSNEQVWTEYLARHLGLPLYNWAVGGAAGDTAHLVVPGLLQQVRSWRQYMQEASGYRAEHTLFTVWIGGNDLLTYGRSVDQVSANVTQALAEMVDAGARHILLLNLPDVSRAPVFKYRGDATRIAAQVRDYNARLAALVQRLRSRHTDLNLQLYDAYALFNDVFANPARYQFANVTDSCLEINRSSSLDYMLRQRTRASCRDPHTFLFWDTLHPTTQTHRLLAERLGQQVKAMLPGLR
ncbi:SGNH/GDSL hydrolase family protein [Pseudoduganella sp. R-34]|uniref:SGNH/GDSL hydrolase family protein n=1 Tax=unclassified Pseudoduganella TaxID=2637179 RepID=UPI003CE6A11D